MEPELNQVKVELEHFQDRPILSVILLILL